MKRSWLVGMILLAGAATTSALAQSPPPAPVSAASAQKLLLDTAALDNARFTSLPPSDDSAQPLQDFYPPAAATIVPPPTRVFGSVEYVLWWLKHDHPPALITDGNPKDKLTGALGLSGTTVLSGGPENLGSFRGMRFTLGCWLDNEQTWSVEANYFYLLQREVSFATAGNGAAKTDSLNVPFFNLATDVEDAYHVVLAGKQAGALSTLLTHRLSGAELNLRGTVWKTAEFELSLLSGFRYFFLNESLELDTSWTALTKPLGVGQTTTDIFGTRNHFYGGQFGVAVEKSVGQLSLNIEGKLALGSMVEEVDINGSTVSTNPKKATVVLPGGIFSGPTNLGAHSRSPFAAVSGVDVNLSYQLARYVTATVGYTFLYANQVVRPGEQIDRDLKGVGRPAFTFQSSDFWMQGANVGLIFQY